MSLLQNEKVINSIFNQIERGISLFFKNKQQSFVEIFLDIFLEHAKLIYPMIWSLCH